MVQNCRIGERENARRYINRTDERYRRGVGSMYVCVSGWMYDGWDEGMGATYKWSPERMRDGGNGWMRGKEKNIRERGRAYKEIQHNDSKNR